MGRRGSRAADGGVEYAPEADYFGSDRFTYTVTDGNGGTAEAEVEVVVEPVNDAPEAVADTAATAEDEAVVIDVLANDTDIEDDTLRVESVTAPSHGTARIAAGGGVTYAPEADYHGPDRFAYTVTDGNGGTAEAEVEVLVASVNDAPEAVGAIPDQALDEGGGTVALDLGPYFRGPRRGPAGLHGRVVRSGRGRGVRGGLGADADAGRLWPGVHRGDGARPGRALRGADLRP